MSTVTLYMEVKNSGKFFVICIGRLIAECGDNFIPDISAEWNVARKPPA